MNYEINLVRHHTGEIHMNISVTVCILITYTCVVVSGMTFLTYFLVA